jgi:hypothetical protein
MLNRSFSIGNKWINRSFAVDEHDSFRTISLKNEKTRFEFLKNSGEEFVITGKR